MLIDLKFCFFVTDYCVRIFSRPAVAYIFCSQCDGLQAMYVTR